MHNSTFDILPQQYSCLSLVAKNLVKFEVIVKCFFDIGVVVTIFSLSMTWMRKEIVLCSVVELMALSILLVILTPKSELQSRRFQKKMRSENFIIFALIILCMSRF